MATPSFEKVKLPLPKDAAPGDTIKFRTRLGAFAFVVPPNAKSGDNVLISVPTTSKLRTPLTILSHYVEKQPLFQPLPLPQRLTPDAASKPQDERASAENPPPTESPQPERCEKASKTSSDALNLARRVLTASPLEHLICPISYELPVDPVWAEDGNIYERECIEQHLANKQTSPVNNTPMGPRLIEARNITNMLQSMADAGKQDELLTAWTKAKAHANRSETLPCGETKVYANGRHVRSKYESPHRLKGRTVHLSKGGAIERVEWVEYGERVLESWDKGTKIRIVSQKDGQADWTHVWDSAERVWRSTSNDTSVTLINRGTVLSKADVSLGSIIHAIRTNILRAEHDGCIDFPEGDATFNFKTFRREFAASHSKHGEVHFYEKGVKVKAVFGPNVKNPAERHRVVFYDAGGQPTRVEWGNQATIAPFRWDGVDYYKDGQHVRTLYSDGTTDHFSSEQLQRKELASGEIYYYDVALSSSAAPPCSIIKRVEFADTHPSHGVVHKFEGRHCVTTYDDSHRFAGFTDTYYYYGAAMTPTVGCASSGGLPSFLGFHGSRGAVSRLALPDMTKPTYSCSVYSVHYKCASCSPDERAFDEFRNSEFKRMQSYDMTKGEILAEIRERWLVIRKNAALGEDVVAVKGQELQLGRGLHLAPMRYAKKRPQDAADEQSAKRACLAAPDAADDDCVFVKVTTLAERDAIGRASAIVID